jgi:transcriptional regulator with XRE-family HTH domain
MRRPALRQHRRSELALSHEGKYRAPLKIFGQEVRRQRLRLRLTQEEIADRAGFDRTYLSMVELGKRNPALLNICRLARALDTTPADLARKLSV